MAETLTVYTRIVRHKDCPTLTIGQWWSVDRATPVIRWRPSQKRRAAGHNRQPVITCRFRAVAEPADRDRRYSCAFGRYRSHVSKTTWLVQPRDFRSPSEREIEAGQGRIGSNKYGRKVSKFIILTMYSRCKCKMYLDVWQIADTPNLLCLAIPTVASTSDPWNRLICMLLIFLILVNPLCPS